MYLCTSDSYDSWYIPVEPLTQTPSRLSKRWWAGISVRASNSALRQALCSRSLAVRGEGKGEGEEENKGGREGEREKEGGRGGERVREREGEKGREGRGRGGGDRERERRGEGEEGEREDSGDKFNDINIMLIQAIK